MHSALLIVQKPEGGDLHLRKNGPAAMAWADYLGSQFAAKNTHASTIEELGDGCVLIKMDKGADALAHVLHTASASGLPYRVLFFETEPQWVFPAAAKLGE